MTGTKFSYQILGTAWPGHFNKVLGETMQANIMRVGMPTWSNDDQLLAKATQKLMEAPLKDNLGEAIDGLKLSIKPLKGSVPFSWGGGSDDIADISWNLPTIVLRYPANIPGLKGHHWGDAIAMATPIAHKGCVAGAKATALTLIDLFTKPELVVKAKEYFTNVQTKDVKYIPFITDKDPAPIYLNKAIQDKFRPELKKYYYDPSKHGTYLEQLGIKYPTLSK